jgi:phospholipase C
MAHLLLRRRPRGVKRAIAIAIGALLAATVLAAAAPAASAQSASPTLTASATSVRNGTNISFTYTAPASIASPENVVAIIDAGAAPNETSVVSFRYAPGTGGTVSFNADALNGLGGYTAFLANAVTQDLYAGPVNFQVTAGGSLAPAPAFQRSIGQRYLAGPYGVATGANGDIWVADTGHDRVVGFSPAGRPVASFWGGLDHPEGIAVDASGDVWVADTGNDRVVEFSPGGRELTSFGSPGSGDGELDGPVALAVSPGGDVYVADQNNNRVEEFTASGGYVSSISVATPAGVALGSGGDIWVSSPSYADGNSVYEFSPAGTQLLAFGNTQAGYGDLGDTGGIAVGPDGRIYVAQPDYGWVTVFDPDGSVYTEFGLQSGPASGSQDLEFPQSLAIGADGQVYVADDGNNRVAEFGPQGAAGGSAAAAAARGGGVSPGGTGPSLPLLLGLALLALAAGFGWFLAARRRRVTAPAATPAAAGAAASAVMVSGTGAPERIMCEMPDQATAEPFTAVQARAAAGEPAGLTRRRLLTSATALSGVAVGAAVLPVNLRKVLATTLREQPAGSLSDIEHIVILMQENRSFDHYFGTMPGVRGFSDPTAITLPDGNPVFYQPDPSHAQGYLTPFHYDTKSTSAQATPDTDHGWATQHQAWDNGKMDQWVPAKGPYTMGYFTQADIPFHWALAEAFTLCDNYHCSVFGPTNPNRLYMWTGMIDPNGTGGGPIISNTPAYDNVILSWTTYPERLQQAGISWQVYQEEDNYDDNALAWFKQIAFQPTSSPLWQRGMQKRAAGWFEADARAGRLPQVSWIVAPSAQTEHPDYMPAAGAEYIASKLDAIASNPDLWYKTLFILTYDENDGIFDHVPPPTAAAGTPDEFVDGEPIGLGFRVPCTLISPWTAGGHVYSDVLDHTSLIRIIEARFGITEPNISAYRRQTCGDFTGALNFSGQPAGYPWYNQAISLAAAGADLLAAQEEVFNNPPPQIPAVNEPLPHQ